MVRVDRATAELLQDGEMVDLQLAPAGSNYTFIVKLRRDEQEGLAVYKPVKGEVPLWDFPTGTLYKREYAAYLFSQSLGWDFIPYTIVRDGKYGVGTVQQFIPHDPRQNYYTLQPCHADQLRRIAVFDLVANNTDRKAAHVLVDDSGKLWGIDHGLTFHADTKIRTVIWDFAGESIPDPLLERLESVAAELARPSGLLAETLRWLLPDEIPALQSRLHWALAERAFPGTPGRRRR